ncbi:hypothetical protein GJ496_005313 [Pomphorhynchus laevis]|nr:hypothetical protein GJ496_005313 [Pomphorhynchus laevis]
MYTNVNEINARSNESTISTGFLQLDSGLHGNGLSHITEIYGRERSGRTGLCFRLISQIEKPILWLSSSPLFDYNGKTNLMFKRIIDGSHLLQILNQQIPDFCKLIIIDSLSAIFSGLLPAEMPIFSMIIRRIRQLERNVIVVNRQISRSVKPALGSKWASVPTTRIRLCEKLHELYSYRITVEMQNSNECHSFTCVV